jgi:hemerythrin-like domain-containing protein
MTINDTTAVPPELNGVLLVHATLRRGATDLLAATDRFGDTTNDPAGLVRLWSFYAGGLRRHHLGEDEIVYPLVASRQPDFADIESEMRAEHDSIDEYLARADAAFARLESDASKARAREAHDVVGDLNETLMSHLNHEETAALPVVASVITDKEMAKIERGFLDDIPRRERGLSLAALDAAVRELPDSTFRLFRNRFSPCSPWCGDDSSLRCAGGLASDQRAPPRCALRAGRRPAKRHGPERSVERAGGADANDMAQQDRVGVGADTIAANTSPTPCDAWPDTLDSVEDFQAAPSGRSRAWSPPSGLGFPLASYGRGSHPLGSPVCPVGPPLQRRVITWIRLWSPALACR